MMMMMLEALHHSRRDRGWIDRQTMSFTARHEADSHGSISGRESLMLMVNDPWFHARRKHGSLVDTQSFDEYPIEQ